MTYIIAEPCIDIKDLSCVDVCPVDCIHEFERILIIDPEECIDCGACEPECPVEAIFPEDALPAKWEAFGWNTHEIDGHDFRQIIATVESAKARRGRPTMIIANTVKGKGIAFMERDNLWHGTPPNRKQFEQAMRELENTP